MHITPVIYIDPSGMIAIVDDALFWTTSYVVIGILAVLGVAWATGVLDDINNGLNDLLNSLAEAINKSLDYVKERIKVLAVTIAIAIESINNIGTYVIEFESGHAYVGKGGFVRASASALFQSAIHGFDLPVSLQYIPASSEREAFKNEYVLMVAYGFHKTDVLYNKIWSPGRSYYFQDFGSYCPGDPGW